MQNSQTMSAALPDPRTQGSLADVISQARHCCSRLNAATSSARSGCLVLVHTDRVAAVARASPAEKGGAATARRERRCATVAPQSTPDQRRLRAPRERFRRARNQRMCREITGFAVSLGGVRILVAVLLAFRLTGSSQNDRLRALLMSFVASDSVTAPVELAVTITVTPFEQPMPPLSKPTL